MARYYATIRFSVDGDEMTYTLVPETADSDGEISARSPVGRVLATADIGTATEARTPDGPVPVTVLEVVEAG